MFLVCFIFSFFLTGSINANEAIHEATIQVVDYDDDIDLDGLEEEADVIEQYEEEDVPVTALANSTEFIKDSNGRVTEEIYYDANGKKIYSYMFYYTTSTGTVISSARKYDHSLKQYTMIYYYNDGTKYGDSQGTKQKERYYFHYKNGYITFVEKEDVKTKRIVSKYYYLTNTIFNNYSSRGTYRYDFDYNSNNNVVSARKINKQELDRVDSAYYYNSGATYQNYGTKVNYRNDYAYKANTRYVTNAFKYKHAKKKYTNWYLYKSGSIFSDKAVITSQIVDATNKTTASKQGKFVYEARKHIGKRYVWDAAGPNTFDCSGLVQYSYLQANKVKLPRVTTGQETLGSSVAVSTSALKPGDLLFWGTKGGSTHVAIYIANGKYIHAANPSSGVKYDTLTSYKPSFARSFIK